VISKFAFRTKPQNRIAISSEFVDQGRKRQLLVDTLRKLIAVIVTRAAIDNGTAVLRLLTVVDK